MTIRGALVLLGGGLAVAGCSSDGGRTGVDGGDAGDGGPAPTCGNVQPCGGDVVGDWTFVEDCESSASVAASAARFSMMAAQSWCPGQTLVGIEPRASGSLALDAAGTYSLDIVFGGYIDINFPASCIAPASCDDATAGFQSQIDAGTFAIPNATSISCSGPSNCLCHAAVNGSQFASGTYSVSGSVVAFTATTGVVTNKSTCVVGNALHILDTSIGSMGQTAIDGDLVAVKQ